MLSAFVDIIVNMLTMCCNCWHMTSYGVKTLGLGLLSLCMWIIILSGYLIACCSSHRTLASFSVCNKPTKSSKDPALFAAGFRREAMSKGGCKVLSW